MKIASATRRWRRPGADFTLGLEKLREAAQRLEERLQAAEKRALLEIDRECATATRLQKELDAALRRAEQRDECHRTEADGLRTQLGDARHQIGVLQGRLDAAESSSAASARELDTLRQQLSAMPSSSARVSPRPLRRDRAAKKPTLLLRTQHRPKGPGT
ncbi:hypothetical protein [Burkholderia ubonensis]|uniref:hypothetical protein n=1 Tax=Burkholderia ubonensis TaxID=101571 RepID=UPI0012F7C7AD|nr:hypothetical protein [Burkholderia ubonensis]